MHHDVYKQFKINSRKHLFIFFYLTNESQIKQKKKKKSLMNMKLYFKLDY